MYTLNDFFCGCGGLGLGFQNAGFKIVGAWDFDKFAVETYRANVGDHVVQADIQQMKIEDVPKADVWAFGFPCQDLSVAGKQAGIKLECLECGEVWEVDYDNYDGKNVCPCCGGTNHKAATRSGMFFEIMRLLAEAREREPEKVPKVLVAENVKALRKVLPVLEAEYRKAGYKCHAQLFNSKFWGVPQNRERYIVVGILDTLPDTYLYPEEQHDFVPKLSTILEKDVPENFYIDDDKARKIIDQALQRLEELKGCHATITPDRVDKRQNGRRAKENEAPMFTLTAQDLHGVILDPVLHIMEKQEKQNDLIPEGDNEASALIHSRGLETRKDGICHCLKGGTGGSSKNFLVERQLTEVCVNDRGFSEKFPQVSEIVPTLRAENHGNHPKIIEESNVTDTLRERERESCGLEQAIDEGIGQKQRNGKGTFVGVSHTLMATDYKGPHLVIERTDTDK